LELTEVVDKSVDKNSYTISQAVSPDIIYDNPKYTYFKSFKNNIETRLNGVKNAIIENKAANIASLGGLAVGLATNYLSGKYAGKHHFTYSGIDWTSFIFESLPQSVTSLVIIYETYRKQGLSKRDTWKNIAVVGALTTVLSLGVYKPLRDIFSNYFMDIGNQAGWATLKAQLSLMTEYILLSSTVSYFTLKLIGRLPKDLKEKERKKAEIISNIMTNNIKANESSAEIQKNVEDVIENYFKQNPTSRKNGHSIIDPTIV